MQMEFDFIVVGAGSAGCALASRLSEQSSAQILLVEAGPDSKSWKIRMPLAVDQLLTSTTYNWGFESEPEVGLGGRRVGHPRGRVVGGSSAINGMVYTRGNPQDYDEWRDAYGCKGWSYTDVLPYFKRMEKVADGDPRYRGTSGPLCVTRPKSRVNPLNEAFLEAGRSLGYPISVDCNGAQHEGFAVSEQTILNGQRNTTAAAYLTPAVRARPNLTILPQTLVEKVLFEGRRATGVQCRRNGATVVFRSRREVILSAGGVGSPHLLKLSGIGPGDELRRHGIDVVLDSPRVGANLQDHPDLAIQYACRQPVTLRRDAVWPSRLFVGLNWFLFKRGVAASNQFEVHAYVRTRAGISKPNLKLEFFPLAISHVNYKPYPIDSFQIHMTAQTTEARGTITLRSADPTIAPALHFNYLSDDRDMQIFREAVALTRELVAAQPFRPYRGAEIEPGDAVSGGAALDDWIRSRATTAYHISCTCRMGRPDDGAAVVGPDLRINGLDCIRVADASVMPQVVTANTNATVIMIGDRAADLCLGKSQLTPSSDPYWVHPDWQARQR